MNLGTEIIEKVLLFDDHRSSDKDNAISTTTLIGSNWKAQRDMLSDIEPRTNIDPMTRRSSTIGTGLHMRAERAMEKEPLTNAIETYSEKEIDGVWISGSFDIVYDGHIMDYKSGYGKTFSQDKIDKAILQMSIYRWLNQDVEIKDIAYVLFISQSNNAYESYEIELMSIYDTETYIKGRIKEIKSQTTIDCIKRPYDACMYCSYSEQDCINKYKEISGGF